MSKFIVAISVDKVQTFMYSCIKEQSQKSQLDDYTLRSVINASIEVKQVFYNIIRDKFGFSDEDKIHYISGKIFFYSNMSEENIIARLKGIYKLYYYANKGQVQIRYTYSKVDMTDKVEIVKEYSQRLKSPTTLAKIIKDNQDNIFNIPINVSKYEQEYNKYCNIQFDESNYPNFVKGLDNINGSDGEFKKGKIAIIKSDVNNMGAIMKSIEGDAYFVMSHLLEEEISIKNIYEYLIYKKLKVCPFYIAGDDIFLATEIKSIFDVVKALNELIIDINNRIKVNGCSEEKLTISIGIDVVESIMPLRYYYESVEEQLIRAKIAGKKKNNIVTSICFSEQQFYLYKETEEQEDNDKYKEKPNNWIKFKNEIKLLSDLRTLAYNKDIVSRSYFHKLLNTVEDKKFEKNKLRLFNQLIYQLLPKNLSTQLYYTPDSKIELILKTMLMRNLLTKKSNGKQIDINNDIIDEFKHILKLYMLFIDNRYIENSTIKNNNNLKSIKEIQAKGYSDVQISSTLFTKPCTYIYNLYKCDCDYEKYFDLFSVFVKRDSIEIEIEKKKKKKKISYYKMLKLNKSIFFKIKNILETKRNSISKIAAIIDNVSKIEENSCKNIVSDVANNSEITNEKQHMRRKMNFNMNVFKNKATSSLNNDFIDSVLIFYECEKSRLIIKSIQKGEENGKNKANKYNN